MELVLVRVKPDGSKASLPISHPQTVFGRHTDCQVRIPSGQISRRHCQIDIGGDEAMLTDLGSANGTFVNGRRITDSVTLAAGDLISMGDIVFVAQIGGAPAQIDAVIAFGEAQPDSSVHAGAPATGPDEPTSDGGMARPAPLAGGMDESSVIEFDFDFNDEDDDDQPPL